MLSCVEKDLVDLLKQKKYSAMCDEVIGLDVVIVVRCGNWVRYEVIGLDVVKSRVAAALREP